MAQIELHDVGSNNHCNIVEKHLIPCCLCKMYLEMTQAEFLQKFDPSNLNFVDYVCPECMHKNELTQRISELMQEVGELKRKLELRNLENSLDRTIEEMTLKMSSLNFYNNSTIIDNDNTLPHNAPCDSKENFMGKGILENSNSRETPHKYLSAPTFCAPKLNNEIDPEDTDEIITVNSSIYSNSSLKEIQTDQNRTRSSRIQNAKKNHHISRYETDKHQIKCLLIGDKTLRNVNISQQEYFDHGKFMKIMHPNMKVQNAVNLIQYLKRKVYPNLETVIVHAGTNNLSDRRSSETFAYFEELFFTLNYLNIQLIISGPIPTAAMRMEMFSRTVDLNLWLNKWTNENDILFLNNFDLYWLQTDLFDHSGKHLNWQGAKVLSNYILCSLRYIDCLLVNSSLQD